MRQSYVGLRRLHPLGTSALPGLGLFAEVLLGRLLVLSVVSAAVDYIL